jgi:Arylsulfotransferase (ASST)/Bacterial Ig-like domain
LAPDLKLKGRVVTAALRLALAVILGLLLFGSQGVPQAYATPIIYISPRPSTTDVSALTSIAIRADQPLQEPSVRPERFLMTGAQSGVHSGHAVLSYDHRTALFYPDQPFTPSEQVSVSIDSGLRAVSGAAIDGTSYTFQVSPKPLADYAVNSPLSLASENPNRVDTPQPAKNMALASQTTYKTVPVDIPYWSVLTNKAGAAPGDIFMAPFTFAPFTNTNPMLLILDHVGELVYYQPMPPNFLVDDWKVLPNGTLAYYSASLGGFTILDNTYAIKRVIKAGNGYTTDNHELQILPNGDALITIYHPRTVDLTSIGGLSNATVADLIIQEIDPNDNIVFEWNSKDYFAVSDTYQAIVGQTYIDYAHGNAVELDTDGNLLISNRHMAEITKINRQTGAIIWRMGGKNNQFTFLNSDQFYFQHDIRRLANGNITLFDNRTNKTPVFSLAEEYQIDEVNKTARLVWSYQTAPQGYSFAMGNTQRMSNGNTVIGWGTGVPALTEVTASGSVVFELALASPLVNYRAFRFPWVGHPVTKPTLAAELENSDVAVYTSWNGATEVTSWRVEAGTSPSSLAVTTTQARTGFETRIPLSGVTANTCYFRTTALDANGVALDQSPITYGRGPGCFSTEPAHTYLPTISL